MTDAQIAKLVGMRTYCQLYNAAPNLYEQRVECSLYTSEYNDINDVSVYVADNVDMKDIKKDLEDVKEKTVQTVEEQLENFAKKLEEFNNKISKK